MVRILVANGGNVLGNAIASRLCAMGHDVLGLCESKYTIPPPPRYHHCAVVDILNDDAIKSVVDTMKPQVIINNLTPVIPPRLSARNWDVSMRVVNRHRIWATQNLLDAAHQCESVELIVTQSTSCFYTGDMLDRNDLQIETDAMSYITENSCRHTFNATRFMEYKTGHKYPLGDRIDGIVLRLGELYGPKTDYDDDGWMQEKVMKREMPVVGDGTGTWSFVHMLDAVNAFVIAANLRNLTGAFNIVDDEPAAVSDWLPYYANSIGAPTPERKSSFMYRRRCGSVANHLMLEMLGVSNAKAKEILRWKPQVSSWRSGFKETYTLDDMWGTPPKIESSNNQQQLLAGSPHPTAPTTTTSTTTAPPAATTPPTTPASV